MKAHEAILILPTQLFEHHPLIKEYDLPIILWEAPRYFTDFKFHQAKLTLHRASMQFYKYYLQKNDHKVYYCPYDTAISAFLKKNKIKKNIFRISRF